MIKNKDSLRGKVAKILNSRELVINIGKKDGVEEGVKFDVLDFGGENIKDPDTNEIIGSIDRPKVRVKVTKVQERLSIASTYKTREVNIGGEADLFSGFFTETARVSKSLMPPKWVTEYETLKTKEKTWKDLDEKDSYVKTDDPVIQIHENED